MSALQRRALEDLGGKYIIPVKTGRIDPAGLFGGREVVVEIGFGMGEATAEIAGNHPDTGFIGIEVHPPGIGKLLSEIEKRKLDNLLIIRHDAVEIFKTMIPDVCLAGIHIFFPDPWPKKKHHKRRLINPAFTEIISRKLKPGGYIHTATDWEEYADVILEVFRSNGMLENRYDGYSGSTHLRPVTKFEMKGLKQDHVIRDIYFTRK